LHAKFILSLFGEFFEVVNLLLEVHKFIFALAMKSTASCASHPCWILMSVYHSLKIGKNLLSTRSSICLELHVFIGIDLSLLPHLSPELLDLFLFTFELRFLLVQHVGQGSDGLLSHFSHLFVLFIVLRLLLDSMFFHEVIHSVFTKHFSVVVTPALHLLDLFVLEPHLIFEL